MTDHKGLPVKGYAETQSQEKIDLVNEGKIIEEQVLRYLDRVSESGIPVDGRFFAIGRTDIQTGFMAVFRSIFQPQRITGDLD